MENKETAIIRTLEVIEAEANAKADALNKEQDISARVAIEAELDKLVKEYNEQSVYTAYATAKAEELPIMALAKVYTCVNISKKKTPSIDLIEGVCKRVETFSVQKKDAPLNILKFIKWLEDRNFKMPEGWISRMSAVKSNIITQWQAFDKSRNNPDFKITQLKTLLQAMVDDMGFIAGKNGNNALVAKSIHAKTILKYANTMTGVLSGITLTPKVWDQLLMSTLHSIATDKAFENTYGAVTVYKEEAPEAEDKPEAESTTEAESK